MGFSQDILWSVRVWLNEAIFSAQHGRGRESQQRCWTSAGLLGRVLGGDGGGGNFLNKYKSSTLPSDTRREDSEGGNFSPNISPRWFVRASFSVSYFKALSHLLPTTSLRRV